MIDPRDMTDDELRAEIAALQPKVREFENYHRRRQDLGRELLLREARAHRNRKLLEELDKDRTEMH